MNETTAFPNARERKRLAVGFHANSRKAAASPLEAWAAANALRSSASDLVKYVNAYLGNTRVSSTLKRAMRIATKSRHTTKQRGDRFGQALAWEIHSVAGSRLILKDGGTAGFSSAIAFSRDEDIGIVVLVNKEKQNPVAVAENLFKELVKVRELEVSGGSAVTLANAQGMLVLNVGTLNYATLSGGTLSYGAAISLAGSTGFTGITKIGAGTLIINNGSYTGSLAGNTNSPGNFTYQVPAAVVIEGTTLTVNGLPFSGSGTFTASGGGTFDLNATMYDLTGKTLTIGNGSILLDTENLGAWPPATTPEPEPEPEETPESETGAEPAP